MKLKYDSLSGVVTTLERCDDYSESGSNKNLIKVGGCLIVIFYVM